jgi:hypothetical protein
LAIFRWLAMYFVDAWVYITSSTIIESALRLLPLIDNDYHPFYFSIYHLITKDSDYKSYD